MLTTGGGTGAGGGEAASACAHSDTSSAAGNIRGSLIEETESAKSSLAGFGAACRALTHISSMRPANQVVSPTCSALPEPNPSSR